MSMKLLFWQDIHFVQLQFAEYVWFYKEHI